ncbi:hypothetical protein B9T24_10095 [Acinetobacter sp. ANC 4654]|uniref:hypothetical protein n=1 Tax=Acinetobacter sp. ANC 4654 TaxID=1977872 RepID=UPI000A35391B|nr:hypothetical protein [Acinetobacter sp. ANC 4654]OTG95094.1 hypothetical protein B9T24_10095 [Acinetobacter sp. ANC 4654]
MKILNGNEAFAALMAGKNILCRAVGDLIDFNDLDQFPATVFAKSDYEFCIKIETMELAGITFTKPLMLEDIQDGQDVYTINTHGQSIYISEFGKMTTGALRDSIRNGFAQRDEVNAKLQFQAMAKVLGRELIGDCLVVRLGDDKPKKRNTAKKTDTPVPAAANDASVPVEKKTSEKSEIQITEQGPITEVKESLVEEFVETDAVKLVEKFTAEINAAETVDAVMQIRYKLSANGHMVRGQIIELNKLGEKRIATLTDSVDEDGDLKIKELQRLQVEAENLINGIDQQAEPVHEHQEHLEILLNDIALAKTPIEANAQIKYTKSWTQEQRKPVMQAINKRLIELKAMEEPKSEETPSLMVQIQNAPDLTALDVLEIDVGSRHPDIQPSLMGYVKKRRFELENGAGPVGAPL